MKSPCTVRPKIVLLETPEEEFKVLTDAIREKAASAGRSLDILEAGCGNIWYLDLKDVQYVLTGVDLDKHALDIRKNERKDLDVAILGDLRTVELEDNSFDVIHNSFVLEHINDCRRVLDNFLRWLRPGGIIILKIPDRSSVYGFLTRITPLWVHVLYKRYVEGDRNAGKPGFAPFPTVYEKIVSRDGIRDWCAAGEATIKSEYGANYYFDYLGIFSLPVKALVRIVGMLSFGKLAAGHTNLTYVIQKPPLRDDEHRPQAALDGACQLAEASADSGQR